MSAATAHRIPGPPQLLPGRPDAVVDLTSHEGAALVGAAWRTAPVTLVATDFVLVGDDLGPSGPATRTADITPHAESPGLDDADWLELAPHELERRLGDGLVSARWYRTKVTVPERFGALDATGATIVFEIVVDDYAEVWVDGELHTEIGDSGGNVVSGFNAPNRVVLTRGAVPGRTFQLAVFAVNGPISSRPENYIWVRSTSLDVYAPGRATVGEPVAIDVRRLDVRLDAALPPGSRVERIATGFDFTEGPVWTGGSLLFSAPDTNTIYRWSTDGRIGVHRTKSGYAGIDIGDFHQPGSNGLAVDASGRLTICQHGNRRIVRVNPHGDVTVLADAFQGRRLNSPNDLVYRSDGSLWFTDPPFGLPGQYDDPKRELPFSGVFRVHDGRVTLVTDALIGPNGIAFSPDERYLYVGDWDPAHTAVVRFDVAADGTVSNPVDLVDLTGEPGDDAIDGLAVAADGTLWICGPGGIWVVAPDGSRLGLVVLPEAPHNLTFGGADGRDVYVTAMSSVYRILRPNPTC